MFLHHNGKLGYQLARLAISGLAALIMYFAIRSHVASDTEALALAWFIPVVWTLGSSLWQRRIDVFGLLGVVAYGIALAVGIFLGAGALPLKLHRALIGGAVGLVCLISFAVGKPIFVLFTRRFAKNGTAIDDGGQIGHLSHSLDRALDSAYPCFDTRALYAPHFKQRGSL